MNKKTSNQATRYFNTLSITDDKWITKTSQFTDKFYNEVEWFANLDKDLIPFVPKIKSYSLKKPVKITYEWITTPSIHSFFCLSFSDDIRYWKAVRQQYSLFLKKCKTYKPEKIDKVEWTENLKSMYLVKTVQRLQDILKDKNLVEFYKNDTVIINGKSYPSLKPIIEYIKYAVDNFKTLSNVNLLKKICTHKKHTICFIHGDLVFSNVFIQPERKNKFICIDPRGSFGTNKKYGDLLYDYAKIYQSAFGLYDLILEDEYKIGKDKSGHFTYSMNSYNSVKVCQKILKTFFPFFYLNQIKLLEALQFLSMVPLHADAPEHQKIFLAHGIIKFNSLIKMKK